MYECVLVNLALSCGGFPNGPTLSALSDHKNNDSSGCVLQDCCIVLTGKPLLLLADSVQRKDCGHLKSATKLQLRIFQVDLLCLRQFVVRWKRKSIATKYAKYVERIVCMAINYNILIWRQSVTQRGTWWTCTLK